MYEHGNETRPYIPFMCLTNRGRKMSSVLKDLRPDEGSKVWEQVLHHT